MQHAGDLGQIVASDLTPYYLTGNTWSILDLSASQSGYAFAQIADSTPPTFVSSELDPTTGVLRITFLETIDATPTTNIDPTKIHIRESGNYTGGGITLTAGELGTTADASTISFTLTEPRLVTVTKLTTPELTIEPGAVRDASGNLIVGTFDLSTVSYNGDDEILLVSGQDRLPDGMAFSNDGAKMFVVGNTGNAINEYDLPTPFDVSTATFAHLFNVTAQDQSPNGVAFSNDGAKMFVVGNQRNSIYEYTLLTPFSVSTATFAHLFNVTVQETRPSGMAFSNDGAKMFVVGNDGNDINEYTLLTPFDVSTATIAYEFSVVGQETGPSGMAFSNDGTKMFIVGFSDGDINEYILLTPFDLSTAAFARLFSVPPQSIEPSGMAFSNDGTKMFIVDDLANAINEYTLSSVYPITVMVDSPPTFVSSELATKTRVLTITFSETIDATPTANIDPTKIHIRESGNYTGGGITMTAVELGTTADANTISFTLTVPRLETVTGLTTPELTIEPGAVRDTSGNLIIGTFDVSTASYNENNERFYVGGQDTAPTGMAFSNDGAKMFVVGDTGNYINEYTLSPPFDVSTASYAGNTERFSVAGQETSPFGMAFSNDGTKMFVVGNIGNDISEYTLSTPFDVSTASYDDDEKFSVAGQDDNPQGMAFSNDGAKMFVVGNTGNAINEYDLPTPFDVSTATFAHLFNVTAQDEFPTGMAFSNDGGKMFVVGNDGNDINEYTLLTPFDVSTATFAHLFKVTAQEVIPSGMAFSNDGAKMFVVGFTGRYINEYTLSSVYPITVTRPPPPTFVSSDLDTATRVLTITFSERIDVTPKTNVNATKIHIRESGTYSDGVTLTADELDTAANSDTITFNLTESHHTTVAKMTTPELTIEPGAVQSIFGSLIVGTFDVSTANFTNVVFPVSDQEENPLGMAFSNDGAKMFVVGSQRDHINEYTLSTPFDVSTATFAGNGERFYVGGRESGPTGMAFSNDGAKMFVVGVGTRSVNEYDLSTPFDVSTATHNSSLSVSGQEVSPTGMAFSNDGGKMFVVGFGAQYINGYTLSTPFDVSTSSAGDIERFYVGGQDSSPQGMAFSNDGAKMFMVGRSNDYINEYTLSTPFDVSTASYAGGDERFYVGGQDGIPTGMAFSNDGAKMFVVGFNGEDINEYTLSSLYPIRVHYTTPPLTEGAFATTWRTTDTDKSITLRLVGSGMTVNWGDGNTTTVSTSGLVSYTYNTTRDYTIQITGGLTGFSLNSADASKLVSLDQWGTASWTTMENAFRRTTNMVYNAADTPVLSGVASMKNMFDRASSFNGTISGWGVSSVTDMSGMFRGASDFNQPLSSWDVSSVTDMSNMFRDASSFNGTLSGWDVSLVDDMSYMFYKASDFNQPLSGWVVSSVTNMQEMFAFASSFNRDLSSWDVSSVENMADMFHSTFDQNLGNWYVTLDPDTIASTGIPGVVGTISAQNQQLRNHSPTYGIVDDLDVDHFEIVPGNRLNMTSGVPGEYSINVTASGESVFEPDNNWRLLVIRVTDQTTDTTPPSISEAVAASLNSITVTFSENVDADATDGSHWSLGGTDASSLTVSANTDPERNSDSMTLTLSGDLPDTRPDLSLIYTKPTTGGITDGTNQLEGATVTVVDGIAPTVTDARTASGTVVTLTLSEDVSDASATPGDFSLSGVASSPTVSSISVSGKTVTLTLSSAIVTSDSPLLSYSRTSGFVQDASSNSLANFSSMTVDTSADITPPSISRAVAASLNSITVTFSENVDADATNGSHWSLGGTDASSLTVSANTDPERNSDSMTLTLSGDLPDTGPDDLELIYTKPNTGGITDGNNQLEGATVIVVDGIAPTVLSVEAVTSRSITVRMSEPVTSGTAGPGGFSLTTGGTAPAVSSISVSGETVTLTLSGPLPAGAVTLNYDSTSGNVADVSSNSLASFSSVAVGTSADITPPSISGAVAASLNSITVTFSENVDADATNGSHWSLGGTDASSLTVSANTDPERNSDSMTLTLSGGLPDTGPDDLELIYTKPNTGGITDGNNQLEGATVIVVDGIAPTVTDARTASGTVVTLTLSEDVSDASATPGDFSLSGVASSPTVSSISVSGKTVTLTLSSAIVTSDSPLLSYSSSSGSIQDISNNSLADFSSVAVDTTADITPPAIDRAVAASLNSVTVTFSENVDADATDGSHWSLGGTDAGSLTVSANTNPARSSSSMTLTLSGDLPNTRPDLTLIYTRPNSGGITDGTNQLEGETVTVVDGIAPTVLSVEAVTSRSITVRMSEPVTSGTAGPGGFSLTTGGTAPAVSSISVSGETVTLTLSGPLPAGAVTLNYDSTSGNVADVSSNSLASFSSVAVDTSADITPPTVTSLTTSERSPTNSADAGFTVTFSEDVTFAGDILVTGGTASPARPTGTASSFTFTVTPDGDGEVTVQTPASSANDNAGNGNLASDIVSLTFDRTEPVITPPGSIRLELGDLYVQPAAACLDAIDRNPTVTVTVDDVDVNQVGVYTLTYTCTDDAGNLATATSTVTVFDPSGFATSITSDPASPTSSPSVEFTVTFEEALGANEVLTVDEIHVSPESPILNLAVSGIDSKVYTFSLDNLNGTYQVSVQNGAVNNALDTPNALAGIRMVVDRTDPAIVPPIGTVIQIGYPYHDATCTDNLDDNPVLTAIGVVDTGLEGTYPVTYRCTDALGNFSILDVVFTVINDPPEFRSASLGKVSKEMVLRFSEPVLPASPLSGIYAHDTGNSTRVDIQGTTSPDTHSSTVTITLGDEVFEQIVKMDAPQIDIDAMAFSDEYGKVMAESVSNLALRLTSPSRGGGEHPPIIDLGTLAYQRLADIPPHIAEQAASHDASEPLEPITPDGTFDFPLVINGYGYLLDDTTNTLVPQILTAGDDDPTTITFTVYTQKDLAHFILHLNLQGENTDYADSDTYITYEGDGTTVVTDPHGYIAGATITVTQEDDSVPERKTVRITVELGEEPMGSTNMVAYMWNTDRKATFIKIIDAFEVAAALLEPVVQAADPEPLEPDSVLPADPEPVAPDFADDAADPEPVPADTLWPDDYDEAQVLHTIRMWSGFESESITDDQLLTSLGFDYPDADMPDWMMTQLGVLVAKGDVTVGEFVLALQYVLEHA